MRNLRRSCLVLAALAAFAFAEEEAAQAASIFVQDPAVFHRRQAELQKMQESVGDANEGLNALLVDADRIAKMNDQCATVSINDVMDDACWNFYQVDLPAFEEKFMQVTGEVRLGYMETVRGLEDRKMQIDACVDALTTFAVSKVESVNLDGGVFLEPLANGFEANYNFALQYEPKRRARTLDIAKKWAETCREMVVRQDGEGFAPYFLERIVKLNDELGQNGSLAVFRVDSATAPSIFIDMAQPVRSAYYLNGVKLFHSRIGASAPDQSNLRVAFDKAGVKVDGATVVTKLDGTPIRYKGSVQFQEKAAKIVGRWYWENRGNTEGVDFGPEYDEDSLAVANAAAAKAADEAKAEEAVKAADEAKNRSGIHPSVWAAVTGVGAIFSDKSALGYGLQKKDLFIMPDIAAAARLRYNFGKDALIFAAVGIGGMVGFAIGDELEQVYMAPLAQFEIGYSKFGFRETAIFPIVTDDEKQWLQFRSGGFYNFGIFSAEAGFTLITNVGSGFYAGFGVAF